MEFETTAYSFSKIVTNTCFHNVNTSRTTWKYVSCKQRLSTWAHARYSLVEIFPVAEPICWVKTCNPDCEEKVNTGRKTTGVQCQGQTHDEQRRRQTTSGAQCVRSCATHSGNVTGERGASVCDAVDPCWVSVTPQDDRSVFTDLHSRLPTFVIHEHVVIRSSTFCRDRAKHTMTWLKMLRCLVAMFPT